jgi:hypothetical protein
MANPAVATARIARRSEHGVIILCLLKGRDGFATHA